MISSLILAATCGGVCNNAVVLKQRVVAPYAAVQSYVAAPVYYFVGAPLRAEAIVEHQKQNDPDWQEFLEFKAFKAGAARQQRQEMHAPPAAAEAEPATPEEPQPATKGAIAMTCAKCHGIPVPKGGFFLDGQPGMKAEDVTDAIRKIAAGEMPPNKQLTREEKNALLQDLLNLEYKDNPEELPPLPESEGQEQ